jgi:2-polyprenyl-3-methyl-5-hydroxy-6-metoxy-1,4-benzoquinol methylase
MTKHWTQDELEHLGACPLCGSDQRIKKYQDIEDWISDTPGLWDYYECQACKALYIDPRPTPATVGRLYERYFTHAPTPVRERGFLGRLALGIRNDYLNWKYGYKNKPAVPGGRWLMYSLPPWFRWEWDHTARHLPKPAPGKNRLLDVGCGNGEFLVAARSAGWQACGLDFDAKAVETARTQGLEVYFGSLQAQYFEANSFDVITLSHVIEHVHSPAALIAECARLLKPGGMLWLATPNVGAIFHQWFGEYWFDIAPHHLIIFSVDNLRRLLEAQGFVAHFGRRGTHAQSHWKASSARRHGMRGMETVCLPAFLGTKASIGYQPLELLTALFPRRQGDLLVIARKA